jgi:hypothetical protein
MNCRPFFNSLRRYAARFGPGEELPYPGAVAPLADTEPAGLDEGWKAA